MTQDISESQVPPGGWSYRIPQTNWSVPNPVSQTLDSATKLTVQHLMKNPAVVLKYQLSTDFATVREQIKDYTRKRLGITVSIAPAASFPQAHSRVNAVAAVGDKVKKLASGFGVLADWLGDGGKPVAPELAQKRAEVCAVCPKNTKGDLTRWFTVPASEMIRRQIASRGDLKLATTEDDKLNVCEVCLCPLKTKVHTPLAHVLEHLKPEVQRELPSTCWMLAKET